MARAKTARRVERGSDRLDRVDAVSRGVVRVAALIKTIGGMADGPARRRMMTLVDEMIDDLKRIPL